MEPEVSNRLDIESKHIRRKKTEEGFIKKTISKKEAVFSTKNLHI